MTTADSLAQLQDGRMPQRYLRNLGTIGIAGQIRLLQAKVAVVGAGGLGGHVVELLARQGVGELLIIDGDSFAQHNWNRQILSTEKNLGMNKALAAAERVAAINSDTQVQAVSRMLEPKAAEAWLGGMDVIVDALDSFAARRMLLQAAQNLRIPLVHGAIAGFTGQVATILPDEKIMPEFLIGETMATSGVELQLGNPAATPAMAAALQSQEVVKLITGVGETLRRQILYFDMEYNLFEKIQLKERV